MSIAPRIAIIGGGFAGATVALHLLRLTSGQAFSLDVVEPRPLLGAGLAYSTEDPEHRVNVAAVRMTAFPDDAEHFDCWFRQSPDAVADPAAIIADGRAYPRRGTFGRYVDEMLRSAARQAESVSFRHLQARAERIDAVADGYRITLDDGHILPADLVVLSPGHPVPGIPGGFQAVADHPRFIANPWAKDALASVRPDDWVLLIGTGLTMADTVASLRARGHAGQITAISRRGQLSQPRTVQPVEAYGDFQQQPAKTVSELLYRVRATARELKQRGRPWEDVIDAIRQQGAVIWGNLSLVERERFQRHLRPYWDSHRYQVAPQIDDVVQRDRRRKALQVIAASFRQVSVEQGVFRVKLHQRGTPQQEIVERHFHAVVNCTGPDHRTVVSGNPVLASLQEAGLLSPDPLGLGIHVDLDSRVIGADGRGRPTLLVAGPLARFTFGELMGLPQVTLHARTVAEQVAAWIAAGDRHAGLSHSAYG